jgi:hypothetical protein
MRSDRFHDPNPPVAGEAEREIVRQRALSIRRGQSIRKILPVFLLVVAVIVVAIPLAHLRSTGQTVNTLGYPATSMATPCSNLPATVYERNGLRFDRPPCWTATSFAERTAFSNSLVDLSNQPLRDPCTQTTSPSEGGPATDCTWPVTNLLPGGVWVHWSSNGSPTWKLENQPGTSLTVAGLPAREQITKPGTCGPIGADETITVEVGEPIQDNFYEMMACLRGPELNNTARQVQAMVDSTTVPAR